jgi:hypothetical protein
MDIIDLLSIVLSSGLVSGIVSSYVSYKATRRLSEEERVHARIRETYLLEGLYPVESALSNYGTALVTALLDLHRDMTHIMGKSDVQNRIVPILAKIRARENMADLINRDYRLAAQAFPRLQIFGMELYSAVKNTLYQYSRWASDTTDFDLLMDQTKDREGFLEGMQAVAGILQQIEVYLESTVRQIDEHVWGEECRSYSDFSKLMSDPTMKDLQARLRSFQEKLRAWSSSQTTEKRKETSLELSKWLSQQLQP